MNTKQLTNQPKKTIAAGARAPAHALGSDVRPASRPDTGSAPSAVTLSFSIEPFVSIVSRHVKVSEKARQAIARDLAEVLARADVQMLGSSGALVGERSQSVREADPILTTEQAAQLVGVSRPFMAKLIDSGAVDLHQKVGNQRRVLRSAVARWRANERSRQGKALNRLAQDLDQEIFPS